MREPWDSMLTAWKLAEAGRWAEAMAHCEPGTTFGDLIAFQARQPCELKLPVLSGWAAYHQADYATALKEFYRQDGDGWLKSWAELGLAKVASDCGRWRLGLLWCALAWRTASEGEHLDLLAQISGARGEILLRAGRASDAASAFTEDLGLLTPGNRYHGRVWCYQSHAWSRMGPDGVAAAKLAYRLSIHSPAESATNSFAVAGLALLGVRLQDPTLLSEITQFSQEGLPGFWIAISQARLAATPDEFQQFQQEACSKLPPFYFAERWWLSGWINGVCREREAVKNLTSAATSFPTPAPRKWTAVELPVGSEDVSDAPWLLEPESWPQDSDGWWSIRDVFMP